MENVDNIMGQVENIKKGLEKLQQNLKNVNVKGQDETKTVTVTANGKGKILELKFISDIDTINEQIQEAIIEATNKTLKKAKKLEAEKKQEIIGDINMPDIPGL